jgi:hypothetical protein
VKGIFCRRSGDHVKDRCTSRGRECRIIAGSFILLYGRQAGIYFLLWTATQSLVWSSKIVILM